MSIKNELQKLTVLYVEDEQDVMEDIVDILSLKIDKVIAAHNGKEALELFRNNKIDLIITDIQMPIMNGIEFIKNVRKVDEETPVIITTAFNEIEFLKQIIDLNIYKYITKPIDIRELLKYCELIHNNKREIEKWIKIHIKN